MGPESKFSAIVNMASILRSPKAAPALVITLILGEVEKETFYECFLEVINDSRWPELTARSLDSSGDGQSWKVGVGSRVCQVGTEGCWENLEAKCALICKAWKYRLLSRHHVAETLGPCDWGRGEWRLRDKCHHY